MKPSIVNGIKALIDRRSDELNSLNISWFGGEPLAAKDVVYDISDHCLSKDFNFSSDITTNATFLNSETSENLVSRNILHYQITLDGLRETHDEVRRYADKKGSFDETINGIKTLLSQPNDIRLDLRVHIRKGNIQSIEEMISTFSCAGEIFNDPRLRVLFRPVEKLSDFDGNEQIVVNHRDANAIIEKLYDKLSLECPAQRKNIEDERIAGDNYVCYACQGNSLVIRADGKISKCTVKLYDEKNIVGHINEDGTISSDNEKLSYWFRGWQSGDLNLLQCPISS